jgi:putative ABC transport system permease protein
VLGLVLAEAAFLGALGAILGIGFGLLLSIPLVQLMSGMMGIPLGTFSIPLNGLIQALIIGFVTTLIAALLPAWQASRISPTEALRARGGGKENFLLRHGWKIGVALLFYAFLEGAGIVRFFMGPQFFMATFLGTILIMPNMILWLEKYARRIITAIYGPMGQFGSRNLARAKGRTSLTVGVLMIGVVMNVAIGAMSTSFKASIDDWINAAVGGDFFINSTQVIRTDLAQDILAVPGIAAVTPERLLQIKIAGTQNADGYAHRDDLVLMLGIEPATYRQVSGMQFSGGEDADAAFADLARGDSVFVSTLLRDRYKLTRGDTLRLHTGHGERDFRVAGIVAMFYQGGQSFIISRQSIEKYWGDTRVSLFVARKKTEAESEEVRLRLKNGIGKTKNLDITAGDQYRKTFSTQIGQVFGLFDAMVWISIIVGALGVINTMTMNILERVREIGTLRSIGMDRKQLAQMVLSEAAAMGALGAVFGVAIAYPTSTVMVQGMSEGSGFPVHYVFPALAFVSGIVVALVVSQFAGLYPTWRASKISVIEAIRSE